MSIFDKLKLFWKVLLGAVNIKETQQVLDLQKELFEMGEKLREKQEIINDLMKRNQKLDDENKELKNEQYNKVKDLQQKQFEETERNQWKNSCK